jgi:hypothetical protein
MILTIKLFTFAFDYHDGYTAKKNDSAAKKDTNPRAQVRRSAAAVYRPSHAP